MISSTIALPHSAELLTLLTAEQKSFTHVRTGYKVQERAKQIIIEITAQDATALKTVVSSVCRVVAVFEKAQKVQ